MPKKKLTFEQALARLEEIASLLETGDAPLADSMKLYKEGMDMAQICAVDLDKAEQEIMLLGKNEDGGFVQMPFLEGQS